MAEEEYIPPKVWEWKQESGGRFANINRPIAGPTHDKTLPGNDHYHAMDVTDLKRFTTLVGDIHQLLGSTDVKAPIASEEVSRLNARRSIVVNRPVKSGHALRDEDLTYKRPGVGMSPIHWCEVVGRVASRDLAVDEVLQWEDLARRDS